MLDRQNWERLNEIQDALVALIKEVEIILHRSDDKSDFEVANFHWLGDLKAAVLGKTLSFNMNDTIASTIDECSRCGALPHKGDCDGGDEPLIVHVVSEGKS